jgi:hypothetical protein
MDITVGDQPDTNASTEDRSIREGVIRDLYTLVAFYTAHPDHPLPTHITIGHYVETPEEVQRIADDYPVDFGTYARGAAGLQTSFRLTDAKTWINMVTAFDPERGRSL